MSARILGRLAVVGCLVLSVLMATPGQTAAPLRSHVKVGAWVSGMVADPTALTAFETTVRRRMDIASYFYGFGDWFPTAVERQFAAGGARDVLISWDMGDTRFTDWTSGRHDAYLQTIGRLAAAYPYPLYVRPWPEMNGDWQTFMPTPDGARPNGGTPDEFIAAWRHVVTTVRSAGGGNIRWVFNPYAATYAQTADVRGLWPGRAYVDVLGIDGYNWGGGPAPWQSFGAVFQQMYTVLTGLDPDLPVWICEVASKEPAINDGAPRLPGKSKAQWITDAFSTTAFPRVAALVWFHEKKERDWRVDSTASALRAFRDQVRAATPMSAQSGAASAPGVFAPTPREGRALRVVRKGRDTIRVRTIPAARTLLLVRHRIAGRWSRPTAIRTDRSGRASVARTSTVIRIVAPALDARVRVAR